jgi:hypothetical protein
MRFNNIAVALIILSLTTSCSTISVPTAKQAAVLDTVTTAVVLDRGAAYEANPVGFIGATLSKVLILNNLHRFEPQTQEYIKRATATLWTAAAVNNLAILAGIATPASIPFGLAAGYVVYTNTPISNKKQTNPKP